MSQTQELQGNSLGFLEPTNRARVVLHRFIEHPVVVSSRVILWLRAISRAFSFFFLTDDLWP
jgi:hypothetical protein